MLLYHKKHFITDLNYAAAKIRELNARLDKVIGTATEEDVTVHRHEMLRLSMSQVWNVYIKGNAEVKMEMGFEEFMFLVAEHTTEDLNKISLLRFYSLINYITEKTKRQ